MRNIIRNNYTPQLGDYHNMVVHDEARGKVWLFDCDGVYLDVSATIVVLNQDETDEITLEVTTNGTLVAYTFREASEGQNGLMSADIYSQVVTNASAIADLKAATDVTDVVGTYADFEDYDTSTLTDNDIIKVLADETKNEAQTYYRWSEDDSAFSLIGSLAPYYTEDEVDDMVDAVNDSISTLNSTVETNTANITTNTTNIATNVSAIAALDTRLTTVEGDYLTAADLYTTTGQNTDGAMTQKAITDMVYVAGYDPTTTANTRISIGYDPTISGAHAISLGDGNTVSGDYGIAEGSGATAASNGISLGYNAATGSSAIAEGASASASADSAIALGNNSAAAYVGAIGLGAYSAPSAVGEINVGSTKTTYGYDSTNYRLISGVYPGVNNHDAVTKKQMDDAISAFPTANDSTVKFQDADAVSFGSLTVNQSSNSAVTVPTATETTFGLIKISYDSSTMVLSISTV